MSLRVGCDREGDVAPPGDKRTRGAAEIPQRTRCNQAPGCHGMGAAANGGRTACGVAHPLLGGRLGSYRGGDPGELIDDLGQVPEFVG